MTVPECSGQRIKAAFRVCTILIVHIIICSGFRHPARQAVRAGGPSRVFSPELLMAASRHSVQKSIFAYAYCI